MESKILLQGSVNDIRTALKDKLKDVKVLTLEGQVILGTKTEVVSEKDSDNAPKVTLEYIPYNKEFRESVKDYVKALNEGTLLKTELTGNNYVITETVLTEEQQLDIEELILEISRKASKVLVNLTNEAI